MEPLVGKTVSHYRIERELGHGGMATVYLADDLKHHRKVAVKVMRPEMAASIGQDRFLREIQIAARLSHPHILPLFDSGAAHGQFYYVMPFIEGKSLRARLAREKQLPVDEALRLTREIASALGHAHHQGLVHRDIKPENVLLADGIALVVSAGEADGTGTTRTATRTGITVRTPRYMAPEQVQGSRTLDGRYALFAESSVITGEGTLTGLVFTPRVFSPTGAFASREVGISFTLGRSAPVTVRVYTRSGRLVREVVTSELMGAGANLVRWDGRDRNGGFVTDGLYLVTVEALGQTERKTLAVVR